MRTVSRLRPVARRRFGRRLLPASVTAVVAVVCTLAVVVGFLTVRPDRAVAATSGWLRTSGATITTADGRPYVIKAVSWFGMETANCAPHGLWQIGLDAGMAQIASFGFTTIRLPYSNECLAGSSTSGIDASKNPGLVGKTPLQVMDAVIASARAHGLTVILDRHRPDSGSQSALWYTSAWSEQRWIDDWVMLAKRYRNDPTVIGVDLHNEPHGTACWGCGDRSRDWAAAATRAGNAVLAANPNLLIVVEGVEQQGNNQATWWGGGLADVAAHPVVLSVPNRVVYSPHDYPASIYPQPWFSAADYPANLDRVWTANWGYLVQRNIAPVLLGEFGTRLQTDTDRQWLTRLVGYLKTNRISFAYWSFNPNSGDTGGLVGDDWVTPQRAKLDALAPILGRSAPTSGPSTPAPSSPAPSSPAPSSPAPSSPAPSSPAPSSPAPSSPAPSSPTPSAPPSSGAPSSGAATASWQLSSSWNAGYVAQLTVRAGSTAKNGWSVSWADPSATGVANAWGMTCAVASGRVTCTGADWARTIPAGQSVTVGLQANSPGPAPQSPVLTLR
ncbi:endoglucanase [Friedmanniella endophytica]|uniref:Endoglucanase n=1 Tax=Microlunatus kandeliicorticis TaxID=1759536 RepID=A0A7W3P6V6_9ACTN|nr:cellulase family glycosylhydrolase [Microlunatus kandeliicorticis]MBA8795374.1 endoglucanase [Microlunatus kandeliicorticis]